MHIRIITTCVFVLFACTSLEGVRAQELSINLEPVVTGFERPVAIAHAGDARLFVVEQGGTIQIIQNGAILPQPFLDISGIIASGGERGLLGLAFHPDYTTNGYFYVNYTDLNGDTVVARYSVSNNNANRANPNSQRIVLTQNQPFGNHNGGGLAFGPDGYLYISFGDGGSGGDPQENAQDLSTLLGKMVRVDVDGDDFPSDPERNYAIPDDNPFAGTSGLDEIWAYGLRNPWRFSFDRLTGDLWIADVGQSNWEEVNFQPADSNGGQNYGWDVLEGAHCFEDVPSGSCNTFLNGGSTLPVLEYSHDVGCSITGGFVYRGEDQPRLNGVYLYADFCSGEIFGTLPNCDGDFVSRSLLDSDIRITTFGEGFDGELYVAGFNSGPDTLYRIVVSNASGGAELTATPNSASFTTNAVGGVDTIAVDLEHTGSGPDALIIDALALSDTDHFDFNLNAGASPCGPAPVCLPGNGSDCSLSVSFTPLREGGFDERLWFLANALPSPLNLEATVPCTGPDQLLLRNATISNQQFLTACEDIIAGPDFTIAASGDAELRAGAEVNLKPGFAVAAGGQLAITVDPVLLP